MHAILERQRQAFAAELPVPLDARRDRLRRAIAMIADNADRLCDALSEDFGHRSREQSMITDIAASIAPLKHAMRHLARWAKPPLWARILPSGSTIAAAKPACDSARPSLPSRCGTRSATRSVPAIAVIVQTR